MADGLDINQLSPKALEFVQKNKIDTDGDGKISRAELAAALANVGGQAESGDVVNISASSQPNIQFLENVKNLAETIIQIEDARREDNQQFKMQINLVNEFINELREKGELREASKAKLDEFRNLLYKSSEGYQNKVGQRYTSMRDAVAGAEAYITDPEHPQGVLVGYSTKEEKETVQKIQEYSAEQQLIASEIRANLESGDLEPIRANCERLLMVTKKFADDMSIAMTELQKAGLEALTYITANMPGRDVPKEMEYVANLATTIGNISKEAQADQEQFKAFAEFLSVQLAKLHEIDNLTGPDRDEIMQQMQMMHVTLESKIQEFAGRYDNVLNGFGNFDTENNSTLRAKSDEVAADKDEATHDFESMQQHLLADVNEMVYEIENNNSEGVIMRAEVLADFLLKTLSQNDIAMTKLESDAMEFLAEVMNNAQGTSGISNAPQVSGSEQKETYYYDLHGRVVQNPTKGQMYIHDGKKVIYGEEK